MEKFFEVIIQRFFLNQCTIRGIEGLKKTDKVIYEAFLQQSVNSRFAWHWEVRFNMKCSDQISISGDKVFRWKLQIKSIYLGWIEPTGKYKFVEHYSWHYLVILSSFLLPELFWLVLPWAHAQCTNLSMCLPNCVHHLYNEFVLLVISLITLRIVQYLCSGRKHVLI